MASILLVTFLLGLSISKWFKVYSLIPLSFAILTLGGVEGQIFVGVTAVFFAQLGYISGTLFWSLAHYSHLPCFRTKR